VGGKGQADEDGGDDEAGVANEEAVAIGVAKGCDENEDVYDNECGEKLVIEDVVEVFDGADKTELELIEFCDPIGKTVYGEADKNGYEDGTEGFFEKDEAFNIGGDGATFAIDEEIAEYENEEKQDEKSTDVVKEINVFPGHDVHFVPAEPGDIFEDAANENEGDDLVLLGDGNGEGTRQIINQEIHLEYEDEREGGVYGGNGIGKKMLKLFGDVNKTVAVKENADEVEPKTEGGDVEGDFFQPLL
jgi:hypothetical protein